MTATLSVAEMLTTVGAACVNQLLLPVDVDGAAGGFPLRCGTGETGVSVAALSTGAVVSGCAIAGGTTTRAAVTAAAVASKRCNPLSPPRTSYFDRPAN